MTPSFRWQLLLILTMIAAGIVRFTTLSKSDIDIDAFINTDTRPVSACTDNPETVIEKYLAVKICISQGNYVEAQNQADLIPVSDKHYRFAHHVIGEAYAEIGEYALALDAWKRSGSMIGLRELGTTTRLANEYELAVEINQLTLALWAEQGSANSLELIFVNFNMAAAYEAQSDALGAIQSYRAILGIRENDFRALLGLSRNLRRLAEYEEAKSYMQLASQLQPQRYEPYLELGQIAQAQEQWQDAIGWYDTALELAPAGQQSRINGYLAASHNNLENE